MVLFMYKTYPKIRNSLFFKNPPLKYKFNLRTYKKYFVFDTHFVVLLELIWFTVNYFSLF